MSYTTGEYVARYCSLAVGQNALLNGVVVAHESLQVKGTRAILQ